MRRTFSDKSTNHNGSILQESGIQVMNHSSRFEILVDGQISCDRFVAEWRYGAGRQFWVATQVEVICFTL